MRGRRFVVVAGRGQLAGTSTAYRDGGGRNRSVSKVDSGVPGWRRRQWKRGEAGAYGEELCQADAFQHLGAFTLHPEM